MPAILALAAQSADGDGIARALASAASCTRLASAPLEDIGSTLQVVSPESKYDLGSGASEGSGLR